MTRCSTCGKEFHRLGIMRHRTMHYEERKREQYKPIILKRLVDNAYTDNGLPLMLSGREIALALGIYVYHVERCLKEMRKDKLVERTYRDPKDEYSSLPIFGRKALQLNQPK